MKQLSGWGRHPTTTGEERLSEDLEAASQGAALSRGLGRSYGDASLPPSATRPCAGTRLADRILAFDPETFLPFGNALASHVNALACRGYI